MLGKTFNYELYRAEHDTDRGFNRRSLTVSLHRRPEEQLDEDG